MTPDLATLHRHLEAETARPFAASVGVIVDAVRERHGAAVAAVLFYGSCLHGPDPGEPGNEAVIDLYVLVERYREVYASRLAALANAILPPNVFYLEHATEAGRARTKYAVMTLAQFRRGTSAAALHPSLWARFCQPVRLAYARDAAVREAVIGALAQAVTTMVGRTAPLLGPAFTAADLWQRAFRETYRAELRAERAARATQIYAWNAARYQALTGPALAAAGVAVAGKTADGRFQVAIPARARAFEALRWVARRAIGKPLTVLRLIKGAFTFDGAVEYALWKIERHSGIRPRLSAWQRRHPVLASPLVVWRLYRRGALR